MQTYLITPLAPLVLRTGKPFGETGGGESFPFPLPSTLAGALRTARADQLRLEFRCSRETVLGWASSGALPAEIGPVIEVAALFPRPLDSLYTKTADELVIHSMHPHEMSEDGGCDLPDEGLLPVLLEDNDKSKPETGPAWWTLEAMTRWLLGMKPNVKALGHHALPVDTRAHVSLEPETLAAKTGQLFQSAGPDFEAQRLPSDVNVERRGWNSKRFGLLTRFSEPLEPTLMRLGGEGRLSALSPCPDTWPVIPKELETALERAKRIRLVLCSPALFAEGWRPGWLGPDLTGECPVLPGLRLKLRAAAVDRWQAISGWDMEKRRPKAARRLVPAGSVYWFEVIGEAPPDWSRNLWLNAISDSPGDRNDGFGLVVPGLWN